MSIKRIFLSLAILAGLVAPVFAMATVGAQAPGADVNGGADPAAPAAADKNSLVKPVVSDCNGTYTTLTPANCGIVKFITDITNALSAAVGVVIVISLTWAGIQYSSAGGDSQKVGAARHRIQNGVIALAMFIFMYAFLTWLIPGGPF